MSEELSSKEIFKVEFRNTKCNDLVLKKRYEFALKALKSSEKECDELKLKIVELQNELLNTKIEIKENKIDEIIEEIPEKIIKETIIKSKSIYDD